MQDGALNFWKICQWQRRVWSTVGPDEMSPHAVSWTSSSRKRLLCQRVDTFRKLRKERSLIALRWVQGAMAQCAEDEALPKDLIQHCKGSRMRYVQYLEDEKKKK